MLSKYFVPALLAVGALAAPIEERAFEVIDVVKVVTVTLAPGEKAPVATPTSSSGGGFLENPAPKPTTTAVVVVSTPTPSAASAPASSSSSGEGSPVIDGVSMLSTVNQWRSAYGLNQLTWNDELASQAVQVGTDGGGVNEVHQLISGLDMGQTITPGQYYPVPSDQSGLSTFDVAYVAWLCEVPTDSQLQASANDGVNPCTVVSDVLHMEYTDTGHHAILVDPSWNVVGCGWAPNPSASSSDVYQGLYTCNFAVSV